MSKRRRIILWIFFLIGIILFLYPVISNVWNLYRNSLLTGEYHETVKQMTPERIKKEWKAAKAYNKQHKENYIMNVDIPEEEYIKTHPYDDLLNPNDNGVMGQLLIPKINVSLAIYHGLGEEALSQGCGHVEGTSLPIGGKSTHAAFAAHRGLAGAKLFTDLDQVGIGDVFFIEVLNKKLAYQVVKTDVVLPDVTDGLKIQQGEDLVTLITCTPYAVNTHRLLVTGKRIPWKEAQEKAKHLKETPWMDERSWMRVFFAILFTIFFVYRTKPKKKEEKQ